MTILCQCLFDRNYDFLWDLLDQRDGELRLTTPAYKWVNLMIADGSWEDFKCKTYYYDFSNHANIHNKRSLDEIVAFFKDINWKHTLLLHSERYGARQLDWKNYRTSLPSRTYSFRIFTSLYCKIDGNNRTIYRKCYWNRRLNTSRYDLLAKRVWLYTMYMVVPFLHL